MRYSKYALRDLTYLRRRPRSMAVIITALLAAVIFASGAVTVSAEGTDVSEYITELSVSSDHVENYEKVTIAVSFSDPGNNESVIHGGDTMTISWPSSGDSYMTGYKGTIPLISGDGITYGEVVISAGKAVVTFNDNVEGMYDVAGSFHFDVVAVNKTETSDENTSSVNVTAGDKTCTIDIHKVAGGDIQGGDLPDFRKQADNIGAGWSYNQELQAWVMGLDPDDPTYTRWILTANENHNNVTSDITVIDQIQEGQELDRSYIEIYSESGINASYKGTWDEVAAAFAGDHSGSSLAVNDKGRIEWTISKDAADGEAWHLTYTCNITDFTLDYYSNAADITWKDDQGKTFSVHDESYFDGIDKGGDAGALPRGVLQVIKKITGTNMAVKGVRFAVEKCVDSGEWIRIADIVTNDKGLATLSKLKTGRYRIYETEVPDYLEIAFTEDSPYEFELGEGEGMSMSHEFLCEDPLRKTDITAVKQWKTADDSEDTGEHPTIWFRLYRTDRYGRRVSCGEIMVLPEGVTEVTWNDLPVTDIYGNEYVYEVTETDENGHSWEPDGYTKEESGLTVVNTTKEETFTPVLPETGGPGTRGFVDAGTVVLLIALEMKVLKVLINVIKS